MDRGPAYEAKTLGRKPSMILSPPPDVRPLKAGHLARTVGSRTHHKRFWRPPRLPRNMRPYMDRNPACEAGPPARKAGVILFHQFRVLMCADEDFHLVCGPHQSSTPATLPVLLCSSQPATLLHCLRLLGQHSPHQPKPARIFRHRTLGLPLRLSHAFRRSFQRKGNHPCSSRVGT